MNEQILAALIALAIAALGYLTTYLSSLKLKRKITTLEEFINSDDTEYYVICPNCKQKIVLNKVKILINKENNANAQNVR